MSYLISNIPYFKCWVRKEFTCDHQNYHGEYIHALAIAVNTITDRSLSFQVVFTGCEIDLDDGLENVHGGAMWARMPIQALVFDMAMEKFPDRMEDHLVQPWDCEWQGNIVALPNNRVRATSPALWRTGEGAPDFTPSQYLHSAEGHQSYTDPAITFNNLYSEGLDEEEE